MGGAWRAAALATEFGFAVVGSLVGGVFLGQLIDRRLGTAPTFFLVGLVLGFATSIFLIYSIYRVQLQPGRPPAAAGERERPGRGPTHPVPPAGDGEGPDDLGPGQPAESPEPPA